MSGDKTAPPKTYAQLDEEAVERFNRILIDNVKRDEKMMRHFEWRGAKFPPFNIEPMPHERQRLGGKGMTAEERAMRKQWLQDQVLAPEEPIYIKELYKKNPIRRAMAAPWDALFNALKPVVGNNYATYGRWLVPKLAVMYGAFLLAWYQVKYSSNTWHDKCGMHMWINKPTLLPGDKEWPEMPRKEHDEFFDKGFKNRPTLLDLSKTSLQDHKSDYTS